ncbi:MAG: NAD-dependent epimerase/dehydratase family protein [Desulforhopalus sp.]|nr:NAD-dependent epimerase/dehydratase family protein [Desulforhopalus sp.]
MNNYLIVGSKGFIGKHLAGFLLKKGLAVWGADVVVDYEAGDHYFLIDASNADFHAVFKEQSFHVCINCSGAASVPDSLKNPMRDFQLNTANVFKLLDAIRIYQPRCRFINLSSAAVYGNPLSLPINESVHLDPVSPYGFHKEMSEQICLEFHRLFQLNTCSLRIFSAFGEGLKKQLFWDLFLKAKKKKPIELFGTGRESRDFIYIRDLCRAIYFVSLHGDFNAQCINVANGREVTIEESVSVFYGLFDYPVEYQFSGQTRAGDPINWVADIGILRKLGYEAQYSLVEGLTNYYQWACEEDSK